MKNFPPAIFVLGRSAMARKWCLKLESFGVRVAGVFLLPDSRPTDHYFDGKAFISDQPVIELNERGHGDEHRIVILADYPRIIPEYDLDPGTTYVNLHNGDVSNFRGLAEICVLAATVQGARKYGATLQIVRRGDEVDGGPVILRRGFSINRPTSFAKIMSASLANVNQLINESVPLIAQNRLVAEPTKLGPIFTYSSISEIVSYFRADAMGTQSIHLGFYASVFPKLDYELRAALEKRK